MFENFQNIPTSYTPNNYQKQYPNIQDSNIEPVNPNKPYELKNIKGEIIGYFWYYGNSVNLTFDIEGVYTNGNSYTEVADYLQNCTLTATIFDLKWNIAHQEALTPIGNTATLSLNNEKSSKLVKGKYTIQLVATHPTGYNETIFGTNDCILEVR